MFIESESFRGKIKPIKVAVIDTGIYEGHIEFTDKIIASRSKCFVQGKL